MVRNTKCWYSFSKLERAAHFETKLEHSVLQQNRIVYCNSIQETQLSISSKGLGNKTVILCLFVALSKLLPLSTVDDLMHYCTRPNPRAYRGRPDALLHEADTASGRPWPRYVGVIVNRHEITVYYIYFILVITINQISTSAN